MQRPPSVRHGDYLVTLFLCVPDVCADGREIAGGTEWYKSVEHTGLLHLRRCQLDAYSSYGVLLREVLEHCDGAEPPNEPPTLGFLLDDVLPEIDKFAELYDTFPFDWSFGGVIVIDSGTGQAFTTNHVLGETFEWRRIIDSLRQRRPVEHVFSGTDTGVFVTRKGDEVILQQRACEVPKEWGDRGTLFYPIHHVANAERFLIQLETVYESYGRFVEEIRTHDWSGSLVRRLEHGNF